MSEVQRLRDLLERLADEDVRSCPLCGNDTREPDQCKTCEIDHMGGTCRRTGHHDPSCPLYEFEAHWRKRRKPCR